MTEPATRGLGAGAMDTFIRFANQTQGRDRLFRATQYTCMLLRYLLEPKAGKDVLMKLKKLESSVSTGRKWFRLGNVVHAIQATEQSTHATDLVPRLCLTLANLNRVVYFICDTVLWVKNVGLASGISKEKWQVRAARHYYYFLLLSLVRDLYEISLQMACVTHERAKGGKSTSGDPLGHCVADEEPEWLQSLLLLLFRSLKRHPPLLLDTVSWAGALLPDGPDCLCTLSEPSQAPSWWRGVWAEILVVQQARIRSR
uniref:Peroxisomal biosis factor 11 alpha n=1 Tax=Chinchilla lanigera TaxID=34839 RepID=A0A8C2VA08_CHILA